MEDVLPDKASICSVSYSSGTESFAGTRGSIQQHSLGRFNTEVDKPLGMEQWGLHNLPQFLNLFLAASNIAVGHIRLLLHLHHGHCGINLGRKRNVNLIFVSVNSNSHALLNVSRSNRVCQINYKLGKLFHIDDVPA